MNDTAPRFNNRDATFFYNSFNEARTATRYYYINVFTLAQ